MGIKGLTKEIKKIAPSAIKIMSYEDLIKMGTTKVYGVDVFSYLYPTQYNVANKGKGNHIREFIEMICAWASKGARLIFVFDGNTNSDAKRDTVKERAGRRIKGQVAIQRLVHEIMESEPEPASEISIIDTDLSKVGHDILSGVKGTAEQRIELEIILRSHVIVSGDKINDLVTLFQLIGATYMQAQGEADFLLASLYKNGHIDGVISEDCDMLTHGINRLVRGINDPSLRRTQHVSVYCLSDILDEAKMSMNQFIDFCILCGCDYCPKISGIGGAIGLRLLRKHTNVNNIVSEIRDDSLKYRPANGISVDDYLFQYERAFRIFSREQEPLPAFKLTSYALRDCFVEWVLSETNYTARTLATKTQILTSQDWPLPPTPTADGSKGKIKLNLKPKTNKIKIKPVLRDSTCLGLGP
jgi:flap endonuclease-1